MELCIKISPPGGGAGGGRTLSTKCLQIFRIPPHSSVFVRICPLSSESNFHFRLLQYIKIYPRGYSLVTN